MIRPAVEKVRLEEAEVAGQQQAHLPSQECRTACLNSNEYMRHEMILSHSFSSFSSTHMADFRSRPPGRGRAGVFGLGSEHELQHFNMTHA